MKLETRVRIAAIPGLAAAVFLPLAVNFNVEWLAYAVFFGLTLSALLLLALPLAWLLQSIAKLLRSALWWVRRLAGRWSAARSGVDAASVLRRPKSVAEVDGFVTMLRAACDDKMIHGRLERLLSMPDETRREVVHAWVRDLLVAEAPRDFVQAIGCLLDDRVAEKAFEVIFRCRRGG